MKYIDYVNIKQGTKNAPRFSNGNTTCATQLPFGMAGFSPQTTSDRGNWYFHPEDRSIEGVRLTHQPCPWIGDYGHICVMPQEGIYAYADVNNRWSGYRPNESILRPDYMSIDFLRYNAKFELTPTERGAAIRVEYNGNLQPRFAVLPVKDICGYNLDAKNRRLTGFTKAHSWKIAENFAMYFAMEFDCDIDVDNCILTHPDGKTENVIEGEGECFGYNIALTKNIVNVKFATSYISVEQAKQNLIQDHSNKDFDIIRQNATDLWESFLSRIQIEAKSEEQMKTFYSCLYRMFLYPHKFHEVDEKGDIVHYCPHDGSISKGVMYVDNGFWDTFRTVYPMFSIIAPEMYNEILEGFTNIYSDTGWLPKWPSPAEVGMMPGTLIDAVVAHAAVTGSAKKHVLEKAFEGMIKHSTKSSDDGRCGRHGSEDYIKYGYIPRDKYHESVNHTLDYVYGDFCIAQTAKVLGKDDLVEYYMNSSRNYKNIFDKETGFMRGKDIFGEMKEDFNPGDWGGEYCEGSAWQNSFAVYHDFEGLAELYGGKEKFIQKLDEIFATPPKYDVGGYGSEIHEMTEMAAADFGQCAISNQPSFHIPYIYAKLGDQKKTNYWVEKLVNEAFSSADDGFPGDEDNGTMAGWYVFSCLGFYPICPGKAEYVKGKKLVNKAIINGKEFDVNTIAGNIINHCEFF